ncbi:hypothetical protein DSO57_1031832 [Entomophthora muscae]|uniref:Uncharacterized protein n=1 Tax=Entomophthora muscae TaxID=34485 RepID=A0ACC2S2N9_9FUNG|nr:hypothetical protein DSO57_1031832 [Entomophthora muscae]
MSTSLQLSNIAKKRNHTSNSKAPTPASTNRTNEPVPSLTNLLQELNKDKVSHSPVIIQEDSQVSYIKIVAVLCWEKIPTLHFRGPVVMWLTLMLALENPYMIFTKRLKVGNNIHWRITKVKLVRYVQLCLQDFSFDGICLTDNQISWALKLLELVFTVWSDPWSAVGPVPLWHGLDSHKYWLQQAMGTTLELVSYSQAGSCQSMTLVGNLVLSGSKVVCHQRLHHMPKYIEWLLRVMYSVGDKSPFLPLAFRWLPSVWIIYAAVAKVLIQLRLGLEAIVT